MELLQATGVLVLLSLLATAAYAVRRRGRIADAETLAAALEGSVLATVAPPVSPADLPALEDGTAASADFDRLGRAVVEGLGRESVHTVVVTGVRPHRDNGWLGANVAVALAREGEEVLLIDGRLGDRDRGSLTGEPDSPGLYEVLQGVGLDRALTRGPVDRLSVLPAGDPGSLPTSRIVESRFGSLTDQAVHRFGVVVVLAPALSLGEAAAVMATDGAVLLAVPSGTASAREVSEQAERLRGRAVPVVGAVLVARR